MTKKIFKHALKIDPSGKNADVDFVLAAKNVTPFSTTVQPDTWSNANKLKASLIKRKEIPGTIRFELYDDEWRIKERNLL